MWPKRLYKVTANEGQGWYMYQKRMSRRWAHETRGAWVLGMLGPSIVDFKRVKDEAV
jgi:hypothetical protein